MFMTETSKKTLVYGASTKPVRYSYKAVKMLQEYDHEVVAIGGRAAQLDDLAILVGHPELNDVHTITMYMGADRQEEHEEYILSLSPQRIIFNPGAENDSLYLKAKKQGIEAINACTLVMLRTGQF